VTFLSAHKHKVPSLPAHDRDLNTTEKIRGYVKHLVRHHNGTLKREETWQQYEPWLAEISNMVWGVMSSHPDCRAILY
jgi:hypothetical protein